MKPLFHKLLPLLAIGIWLGMTGVNYYSFDLVAFKKEWWRNDIQALPRPELVKLVAAGNRPAVADLYWLFAVNYYGSELNQKVCYGQLGAYLEIVRQVDPNMYSIYRFGGLAMPCPTASGWQYTKEANQLLRYGIEKQPNDFFLRMLLSYNMSEFDKDYVGASEQLRAASLIPKSPKYLAELATRMLATTGNFLGAEQLSDDLAAALPDEDTKEAMRTRKLQLRTAALVHELTEKLRAYEAAQGHKPASLTELLGGPVPEDPLGGELSIDVERDEVVSSKLTDNMQLHVHP